jgi:histidine ammonia-lyase
MLIEEDKPGLSSGFMIPQYVAAALVSENKTLSHPDSVDSIPTSANQEDHVSMSMNAARHAWQIVRNTEFVIAIELLCAVQAVEIRTELLQKEGLIKGDFETLLGPGINAALNFIRLPENQIPKVEKRDAVMYRLIRPMTALVRSGQIVQKVRQAVPGLTD